mmetsp:Transcript_28411/g.76963  ORF Transcript_28411/g.76963 Transcript_28411/m.76963 type:complete len:150 (-) Transcript_28411:200-649(-)
MFRSAHSSAASLRRMHTVLGGRCPPRPQIHRLNFYRTMHRLPGRLAAGTRKRTKLPTRRTFFSDQGSPELNGGARFTPLEDFLLDVSAWMVAVTLWYAPRMDLDDDDLLGENQNLEYREDYGPCPSSAKASRENVKKPRNEENSKESKN